MLGGAGMNQALNEVCFGKDEENIVHFCLDSRRSWPSMTRGLSHHLPHWSFFLCSGELGEMLVWRPPAGYPVISRTRTL